MFYETSEVKALQQEEMRQLCVAAEAGDLKSIKAIMDTKVRLKKCTWYPV